MLRPTVAPASAFRHQRANGAFIRDEKPVKVNIDVGGLGVGVADRLEEQGYGEIINRVNFGGKPIEPPPFDETGKPAGGPAKRRAEMWLKHEDSIAGPALRSLTATACIPTSARSANHVLTPADVYFGRAEAILAGWANVRLSDRAHVEHRIARVAVPSTKFS